MATIGSFIANGTGYNGTIKTLNLSVKATIRPVERASEKGPHFPSPRPSSFTPSRT
jgi:uncharacterized protein (DUF736 family)